MPKVADRWRRPITVFAALHDPDSVVRFGDRDEWREGVRWVTDRAGFQRMWEGQVCANCTEPQPPPAPNPIPERCELCGFAMRKEQKAMLMRGDVGFRGEEKLGPSTSISEELDRLDDKADRWRWEQSPTTGIVVPRKL